MFKKSKSKVLVDSASEEDDVSWHHQHTYKVRSPTGRDQVQNMIRKVKGHNMLKKVKSKKERKDKKMFSSKDDEHFLITGVKLADRRGSHKKVKEEEKEKNKPITEKSHCFWDSVTMTMRQITPTKKLDKIEGWEPPQLGDMAETLTDDTTEAQSGTRDSPVSLPQALSCPLGLPSWTGLGLEEDSSRYANLSDSKDSTAVKWTALAKGKLAGIRRRSRGSVSESSWEGFK
ncbi:testis development-related protein [Hypomesus transpacificus]|uniref:testis development-related protein n=1 Tax=Hypomesus transpacificus TaxID=137520 RepID=UPI001F07DECB|nr:testis development-related protein [Hypomesus transpacificus]